MSRMLRKVHSWFRVSIVFLVVITLLMGAAPPIMPVDKSQATTMIEQFPICTEADYQWSPQIYDKYVVWVDTRNGNGDIYGYNLVTKEEFPICTAIDVQINPRINPRISGNYVVWSDGRNGNGDNGDIYGYNLVTKEEFPICTAPGVHEDPAIYGNYVVWTDGRWEPYNNNTNIYGYNLVTKEEFPICTVPHNQRSPQIYGNYVIWEDGRTASSTGIYGYDLSTSEEFAICTDDYASQTSLQIYGNYVIWARNWNSDSDNYIYTDIYGAKILGDEPQVTVTPTTAGSSITFYTVKGDLPIPDVKLIVTPTQGLPQTETTDPSGTAYFANIYVYGASWVAIHNDAEIARGAFELVPDREKLLDALENYKEQVVWKIESDINQTALEWDYTRQVLNEIKYDTEQTQRIQLDIAKDFLGKDFSSLAKIGEETLKSTYEMWVQSLAEKSMGRAAVAGGFLKLYENYKRTETGLEYVDLYCANTAIDLWAHGNYNLKKDYFRNIVPVSFSNTVTFNYDMPGSTLSGAYNVKKAIESDYNALISAIPDPLPYGYPVDQIVASLNDQSAKFKRSKRGHTSGPISWPLYIPQKGVIYGKDWVSNGYGQRTIVAARRNIAYNSNIILPMWINTGAKIAAAGGVAAGLITAVIGSSWGVPSSTTYKASKTVSKVVFGTAAGHADQGLYSLKDSLNARTTVMLEADEMTSAFKQDISSTWVISSTTFDYIKYLLSHSQQPHPIVYSASSISTANVASEDVTVDVSTPNITVSDDEAIGDGIVQITINNTSSNDILVSPCYEVIARDTFANKAIVVGSIEETSLAAGMSKTKQIPISIPKNSLVDSAGYDLVAYMDVRTTSSTPERIGPYVSHFYAGTVAELASYSSHILSKIDHDLISDGGSFETTVTPAQSSQILRIVLTQPDKAELDLHLYDEAGQHVGRLEITDTVESQIVGAEYDLTSHAKFIEMPNAKGKVFRVKIFGSQVQDLSDYDLYVQEIPDQQARIIPYGSPAEVDISNQGKVVIGLTEYSGVAPVKDIAFTAGQLNGPGGVIPASSLSFSTETTMSAGETKMFEGNIEAPADVQDGVYTGSIMVTAACAKSGVPMSSSIPISIMVDRTAPSRPIIKQPALPVDALLNIEGTATAGSLVELWVNGKIASHASCDSSGRFLGYLVPLEEGANAITAIAEDDAGNRSESSNPVSVFYDLPPTTPTGFKAIAGIRQVTLSWNANLEPDLAGYNIYHSESPIILGDKINAGPLSPLLRIYTDKNVTGGKTYYYRVSAVDSAGNESTLSDAVSATPTASGGGGGGGSSPPDTQKPAPPEGLKLVSNKQMIHLAWNPNKEKDIAGYNICRTVYRSANDILDSTEKPLNETLLTEVQYQDKKAASGVRYNYFVVAVNKDGKKSDPAVIRDVALAEVKAEVIFSDIPSNAWYKDFVSKLISLDIIGGYSDGTFKPNKTVSRAEFAKMICIAIGWTLENPTKSSFKDVSKASWAWKYIETAKMHSIINGYNDGTFKPDSSITRAEIAAIIAKAKKLAKGSSKLKDINNCWARDYINSCVEVGVIGGYPNNIFKPNNTATRAEAAKMIAAIVE